MMRRLWTHYGPRSLAGQLTLVAALALVAAQLVNMALLVQAQRQERLSAIAAAAAAQLGEAIDRVSMGLPLSERPPAASGESPAGAMVGAAGGGAGGATGAAAAEAAARRQFDLATAPRFPAQMTGWPDIAARTGALLVQAGMAVRQVRAARMTVQGTRLVPVPGSLPERFVPVIDPTPMQLVAVAAQLPDGRWVTVSARIPVGTPGFGELLAVQTIILLFLLLIPLLFLAARVQRPLAALAVAARNVGPGDDATPVEEHGPEDVRALTRAFNAMRERIAGMLTDKDRMLGAIGHDLRTPLASLRVRVEMVEDVALRDRMATTIADMAAMLDDILAVARAGQPREAREPTDLAALIADVVADYQAMGRPVRLAADGALPMHSLRPSALRGALRNLIDNAVNYGGSATVGVTQAPDGAIAIHVDDDGPGIPDAQIPAMLEPFARAESSRNRDTGGSGLGLALARAMAQAEGGELLLANRPGGGLSATIALPGTDQT